MNKQPRIPDLATRQRLLTNLRRTHLEMQESNLELEEIIVKFEDRARQQKLARVRGALNALENGSGKVESVLTEAIG
jgi:hypothetical protein